MPPGQVVALIVVRLRRTQVPWTSMLLLARSRGTESAETAMGWGGGGGVSSVDGWWLAALCGMPSLHPEMDGGAAGGGGRRWCCSPS